MRDVRVKIMKSRGLGRGYAVDSIRVAARQANCACVYVVVLPCGPGRIVFCCHVVLFCSSWAHLLILYMATQNPSILSLRPSIHKPICFLAYFFFINPVFYPCLHLKKKNVFKKMKNKNRQTDRWIGKHRRSWPSKELLLCPQYSFSSSCICLQGHILWYHCVVDFYTGMVFIVIK